MFVGISVIVDYPNSILNMGEDGSPKTCMFGGVPRRRMSSQCVKSKLRNSSFFEELYKKFGRSCRTRHIPMLLRDGLKQLMDDEAKLNALVDLAVVLYALSGDDKTVRAFANEEIEEMSNKIYKWAENLTVEEIAGFTKHFGKMTKMKADKDWTDEERPVVNAFSIKSVYGTRLTVDICFFGRMVESGSKDATSTEGAVYVAHAFSTHKVEIDIDFFSAVDELTPNGGAGHLNNKDFASSCMYQYMMIDTDQLMTLMSAIEDENERKEFVKQCVKQILLALVGQHPKTGQHSFASMPMPSAVMVELRDSNSSYDYASAFERPVKPDKDGGFVRPSVIALRDHAVKSNKIYDMFAPTKRLWLTTEDDVTFDDDTTINCDTLSQLLSEIDF